MSHRKKARINSDPRDRRTVSRRPHRRFPFLGSMWWLPVVTTVAAKVAPAAAQRLVAEGYRVLDVRETNEFDAGHIDGAISIPLAEVDARLAEIPSTSKWLVVCRTGVRSGQAADNLAGKGYSAATLTGGLTAWMQAGMALVASDGSPGHVA